MKEATSKKKILLAVSGSIAAYKAAHLIRLLVKSDYEVKVLMTRSAMDFISPITLSTLSKNEVISDIHSEEAWNNHVELGLWADYMIVAPATANTMAKMATGITDNMLMACYLSARCPVAYAPAMDLDMYKHPSTLHNMAVLSRHGVKLIPATYGELASGLVGEGRMAEPSAILAFLESELSGSQDMKGRKVMVTAGPTYEYIDPVRYIGNHSSGKMGYAIACNFAERGAEVDLILGPSSLSIDENLVKVHRVRSAKEMYNKASDLHVGVDIAVFAAAVADYRPVQVFSEKVKKKEEGMHIQLEKTEDIALSLGKRKSAGQLHIGFALETNNEELNAKAKLEKKHFDLIVLNSLRDPGAGFNHDTNKVSIYFKDNKKKEFQLKSKAEVAIDIVNCILEAEHKIK